MGRGGGRSTLSLRPTPEQVSRPPWGRAWVHSLRQSQEGGKERRNCNSSRAAGHTGKGGEPWMQTHGREGSGGRVERREKTEYTRCTKKGVFKWP